MEYILIADDRLKVILGADELSRYELDSYELDYSDIYSKKVFEEILDEAKHKLGFDTSGHRILLELFTSTDGGCELFITRLGEALASTPNSDNAAPESSGDRQRYMFAFECLSALLGAIRHLASLPHVGESSVWTDGEKRWFLELWYTAAPYNTESLPPLSFLCEFGEREDPDAVMLYLSEYASIICERNAIELLASL